MPPCSRSFLRAASSVMVNLSLSFINLSSVMAVITSDSDLLRLCRIRLIGSCGSCMQFGCRIYPTSPVTIPEPLQFHLTPVNVESCGGLPEWYGGVGGFLC